MSLQNQTPVPILQNEWEFNELLKEYIRLRPKSILEIGTFFGGTLYHWLHNNNNNLESVVCVDLPIGPEDGRYEQMKDSRKKWEQWVMETFKRPSSFHDIQGNSTSKEVIERAWRMAGELDFLFIDGDHSYEGVKSDYENYHKLVQPGGVIAFHDIVGYWTVKKFWDEVKIGKKYKEICDSGPDGWGIGILYV